MGKQDWAEGEVCKRGPCRVPWGCDGPSASFQLGQGSWVFAAPQQSDTGFQVPWAGGINSANQQLPMVPAAGVGNWPEGNSGAPRTPYNQLQGSGSDQGLSQILRIE